MANAILSNTSGAQAKDPTTGALISSPPANPMKAMTSVSGASDKEVAPAVVEEEDLILTP
jgi:hypothetical protein